MKKAFDKHRDKRINEISVRLHNSKIKKREKEIIFSKHDKKAYKNIN